MLNDAVLRKSEMLKVIKDKFIGTSYEWESHFDNIIHVFNFNLKKFTPENLLDIGCCDSVRAVRLAKFFDIKLYNVYGVDIEKKYLDLCNKEINTEKVDLETDILPFPENTFDLVVCNQVLEHLKNYEKVIDEIIRVTKKNGYIVIGIPNLSHLINRILLLFGKQPMCIDLSGPHVRGFSHEGFLKKIFSIKKINLIDYNGSLMYPLPFFLSNMLCKYFVGLSGYICYLLKKEK